MIIFPSTELPGLTIEGFTKSFGDARIKTQMQNKQLRTRRLSSFAPRIVGARMVLPLYKLARFWRFWDIDTAGGVLPFLMKDQEIDGAYALVDSGEIILTQDSQGFIITKWWLCVFGDQVPSESAYSDSEFELTFNLEIHKNG